MTVSSSSIYDRPLKTCDVSKYPNDNVWQKTENRITVHRVNGWHVYGIKHAVTQLMINSYIHWRHSYFYYISSSIVVHNATNNISLVHASQQAGDVWWKMLYMSMMMRIISTCTIDIFLTIYNLCTVCGSNMLKWIHKIWQITIGLNRPKWDIFQHKYNILRQNSNYKMLTRTQT